MRRDSDGETNLVSFDLDSVTEEEEKLAEALDQVQCLYATALNKPSF